MKDPRHQRGVLGNDALFCMIEIVNDRDEVVWSRMVRMSSSDAASVRAANLADAAITFEKAYEELPIFD